MTATTAPDLFTEAATRDLLNRHYAPDGALLDEGPDHEGDTMWFIDADATRHLGVAIVTEGDSPSWAVTLWDPDQRGPLDLDYADTEAELHQLIARMREGR